MDDNFREAFNAAYMELGGLGERVLGKCQPRTGGFFDRSMDLPNGFYTIFSEVLHTCIN